MNTKSALDRHRLIKCIISIVAVFVISPLIYMMMSLPVLGIVQFAFFIGMAFSFLFVIMNLIRWKRKNRAAAVPPLIFLGVTLFFFFGWSMVPQSLIMNKKARDEIKHILRDFNINGTVVRIDNEIAEPKEDLIAGIKSIKGSSLKPSSRYVFKCDITCGERTLQILIAPSSYEPNFYWVYYPKYHLTKLNAIGGFYAELTTIKNPYKTQGSK